MKTQLQAMRKRAGFKSAKAFAEHIGMAVGTYTDYEQGRRMFTLEKACEFARELDCTLDELAGRVPPQTAQETAYDERQASLNDYSALPLMMRAVSVKAALLSSLMDS